MDKETQKKLIKNFPKDVVKDAPKVSSESMYLITFTHKD